MGIRPWAFRAMSLHQAADNSANRKSSKGRGNVATLPVKRRVLPDTIMIVDSHPVRLGDLSDLAQAAGMRVLAFSDAQAALGWLSEKPMPEKVMMAWSNGSWASERLSSLLSICRADFMIYARDIDAIPAKFKRFASATVPLGTNLSLLIDHLSMASPAPKTYGSRHIEIC